MKKVLFIVFIVGAIFITNNVYANDPIDTGLGYDEKVCNPKPTEGDLVLRGPHNSCFTFRPISVRGDSPFGGITFLMGDADSDNFRTPPTRVMIGGSFPNEEEEGIWTYYLGKYEITRGQYRAVMGELPKALSEKNPPIEEDNMPITNVTYFEAMNFINTLNEWFYANIFDDLPFSGDYPAFVRLPSEVEWEFAARGGMAVEPSVFEGRTPYAEQLSVYEWFGGPKSSHNKMKEIGLLKPNPLGLHDMLGNVQEMTYSQYQLEYYQGRSGGFVCRGASYIANEDVLSVAQRQEEPYYLLRKDVASPNAKLTLGLRLALSAPLLTDRDTIADFEDAWEDHREGSGKNSPAALSVAPISDQEEVSVNNALDRLQTLKADPAIKAIKNLEQELSYTEAALRTTLSIRSKADADAAMVWLRQSLFLGQLVQQYLARYVSLEERAQANPDQPAWQERVADADFMIKNCLEEYRSSIVSLNNLPAKFITEALLLREKQFNSDENKENSANALQVLKLIQEHYEQFGKSKRADLAQWRANYLQTLTK